MPLTSDVTDALWFNAVETFQLLFVIKYFMSIDQL